MVVLKENAGIPLPLLWTLAVIAGLSVANLYYNQPLLNLISRDLHTTDFEANLIAVVSQAAYACGLFFITPLGDMLRRKRIVLGSFMLLTCSMFAISVAGDIRIVWLASVLTGICSVMPHIFIPIASQFSTPETKSRNVGILLSGLLTGILSSRVVSGLVGEVWGWRAIYYVATGLMILSFIVVWRVLPDVPSNYRGSYAGLMRSVFALARRYPSMRVCSLRAALSLGSFLAMWSTLSFKMSEAPFYASNDIIGLLGLCGIAGALTASGIGKYIRTVGVRRFNFIGLFLQLAAWLVLWLGADSYAGILGGIILIDVGMQIIQLSNQSLCLSLEPEASSRANTVFMSTFFVGGTTGTLLSGIGWGLMGWSGVVAVGAFLSLASLTVSLFSRQ